MSYPSDSSPPTPHLPSSATTAIARLGLPLSELLLPFPARSSGFTYLFPPTPIFLLPRHPLNKPHHTQLTSCHSSRPLRCPSSRGLFGFVETHSFSCCSLHIYRCSFCPAPNKSPFAPSLLHFHLQFQGFLATDLTSNGFN